MNLVGSLDFGGGNLKIIISCVSHYMKNMHTVRNSYIFRH